MGRRMRRPQLIFGLLALAVLALGASEGSADRSAGATARPWAVKVIVPGQPGCATRGVTAPDDAVAFDGAVACPADGAGVPATSVTSTGSATAGTDARASGATPGPT